MRVKSPFGTIFVTLNETAGGVPFELFLNIGKCGSDIAADAEAIGRLCTLLLRMPSQVPKRERIADIIKHLERIGGSKDVDAGKRRIRSVPDAVAFALSIYLQQSARTP
jgi:ribonucleoside-diphosphate reductase alpha chain